MNKVLCVGMVAVDIIVQPVNYASIQIDTQIVDTIHMQNGGNAMNTAIVLSKLGGNVCLIGRIGNDESGRYIKRILAESNIESRLVVDDCHSTSTCIVLVSPFGERTFLHCHGANATLCSEDISDEVLKECNYTFVGGVLELQNLDGYGLTNLLKRAKYFKHTTFMDIASDTEGIWMGKLKNSLEYVDFFMPSYDDAVKISSIKEDEAIADFFINQGTNTVVIKKGADGYFVKNSNYKAHIPAFTGLKVIDTIGAGDSFCAGYIYGFIQKLSTEKCAVLGNACGGICTTKSGATNAAVDWSTLCEFISAHTLKSS